MGWFPVVAVIWVLVGLGTALLIGAAIRAADAEDRRAGDLSGESRHGDAESA